MKFRGESTELHFHGNVHTRCAFIQSHPVDSSDFRVFEYVTILLNFPSYKPVEHSGYYWYPPGQIKARTLIDIAVLTRYRE